MSALRILFGIVSKIINIYIIINNEKIIMASSKLISKAENLIKYEFNNIQQCKDRKFYRHLKMPVTTKYPSGVSDHMFTNSWTSLAMVFQKLAMGVRNIAVSAMKKPEVIFILGGPGAGKGTTCTGIVKKTGYVHLSAGDLLRAERTRADSEFGQLIETHIRNGTIVPVAITCSLLDRAMQTSPNQHKRFLIDGFPRNQDNLDGWSKAMSDKAIVKAVFYLECSQELCTQRCINRGLKGSGRSDDNAESLIKRYETFLTATMPIIKYYEQQGLLHTFNSKKSPKAVMADVYETLKQIGWADHD